MRADKFLLEYFGCISYQSLVKTFFPIEDEYFAYPFPSNPLCELPCIRWVVILLAQHKLII